MFIHFALMEANQEVAGAKSDLGEAVSQGGADDETVTAYAVEIGRAHV